MPAPVPDYTHQLNEIVRLLSEQTVPTWMVAVISSAIGAILAFALELSRAAYQERRKSQVVRRAIYSDIVRGVLGLRGLLASYMQSSIPTRDDVARSMNLILRQMADLGDYRSVYLQLPERQTLDRLKASLQAAMEIDPRKGPLFLKHIIYMVRYDLEKGTLSEKELRNSVSSATASDFFNVLQREGQVQHFGPTE